ncbi:MAG: Na+/H+ antiporter subunit E [Geobacteraceae bacterium]|nr:Na+/H+ antiporter subunit E [Geobacteraceae bacterium]
MTAFLANILLALPDGADWHLHRRRDVYRPCVRLLCALDRSPGPEHRSLPVKDCGSCRICAVFPERAVDRQPAVAHDVSPRSTARLRYCGCAAELESDLQITLLATLITLTPGTLSLHVAEDRRTLYVHAMYIDDSNMLVERIKQGFERRVREVFQ